MFLQEKVSDINRRMKVLESASNIMIWGAGKHTCKIFELTDVLSYSIKGIVDISEEKQGNPCFGFIVQNPHTVSWNDVGAVIISVPGQETQITEKLVGELRFSGNIVTLYEGNECTPFYLLYDKKVESIRFLGDYDSWRAAYDDCEGYESANILDTVSNAIGKVIRGEAVWERDGYLFYETKYNYCLCAAILRCALQNENKGVRILDIGGGIRQHIFSKQELFDRYKKHRIRNCRAG